MRFSKLGQAALLALALGACATAPDFKALVASGDRSEADRAIDQRRAPVDLLAFYGLRPGMRAADLSAGGGYNTELMARAVAPGGRVWAQTPAAPSPTLTARLKTPALRDVVHVSRGFEDPLPAEARDLDAVVFNFNYHDVVNTTVDRAKMNRAVFGALKSGGVYVVADHSGRPGTGASETKTLHRIEESVVRGEIEAAGFRFVAEGGFLRNPQDPRTAPSGKNTVPNDEFVLKFVKP